MEGQETRRKRTNGREVQPNKGDVHGEILARLRTRAAADRGALRDTTEGSTTSHREMEGEGGESSFSPYVTSRSSTSDRWAAEDGEGYGRPRGKNPVKGEGHRHPHPPLLSLSHSFRALRFSRVLPLFSVAHDENADRMHERATIGRNSCWWRPRGRRARKRQAGARGFFLGWLCHNRGLREKNPTALGRRGVA